MTPIAKNVIVTDEAGNFYEPTYPKRAQGLIKNGRARAIGENKICLIQNGVPIADVQGDLPLTERKGHTMNEQQTTNNKQHKTDSISVHQPADSRAYLDQIMAQVLKSFNEPVYFDPNAPNADYHYQRANQQRDKLLDKLIMLHAQMREAENTVAERPDFKYIKDKLDRYEQQLNEFPYEKGVNDDAKALMMHTYAMLLSQYMKLQETAKRQALQDRVINHAWIDQNQKLSIISAMNDSSAEKGKRVSMDTSQGYNFDDMPGMPNFVKQLINKGYLNPQNTPMMMQYIEEWRKGGNSYPGTEPRIPDNMGGMDNMDFNMELDDMMENLDDLPIPDFVKKMLKKNKNSAYWQKQTEDDEDEDDEE